MFKSLKLGTKIISLLIVLVILSVSVVGIISTNSQVSVISDNLTYTTKELSISLSQEINGFLTEHVSLLESIALTNDLKLYNGDDQKNILKEINKKHSDFALIFVTDNKGNQVARSDDKTQFDDMSDRDYFKDVNANKKSIISDVLISKTTGKPAVVIAIPIFHLKVNLKEC